MSQVVKCDKCGEIVSIREAHSVKLDNKSLIPTSDTSSEYDMCEECYKSLENELNSSKIKKNKK